MESLFTEEQVTEFKEAFKKIPNGDGKINFEEFLEMMVQVKGLPNDITAEQMFKFCDKNDDGFITCNEMKKFMLIYVGENLSDVEANELIEMADKDGDGKLNFEEFKAAFDKNSDDLTVLAKMASLSTEEEVTELKKIFEEIDVDGKGTITFEKLFNQMELLVGRGKDGWSNFYMVAMADTNGDGMINFEEFLEMMVKGLKGSKHLTAEQMFKIYDKNGDGFITCDELKKLWLAFGLNASDANVNKFIKKKDKDGDGKFNFEEFKAAFNFNDDSRTEFVSYFFAIVTVIVTVIIILTIDIDQIDQIKKKYKPSWLEPY